MSEDPPISRERRVQLERRARFWSFDRNGDAQHIARAEFPGHRDSLNAIRDWAAAASRILSDDPAIAEFVMVVDELCSNIVEHGYEQDGEQGTRSLLIEVAGFPNRIECIVTDLSGIHFAPNKALRSNLEVLSREQRRGFGLTMIYQCVDKVEHQYLPPQGNQVRLVKYKV